MAYARRRWVGHEHDAGFWFTLCEEAPVHTFLIIARNSAIIVAALTLFAVVGTFISIWLSDNSHEAQPQH